MRLTAQRALRQPASGGVKNARAREEPQLYMQIGLPLKLPLEDLRANLYEAAAMTVSGDHARGWVALPLRLSPASGGP